jgi:hypothetical protein
MRRVAVHFCPADQKAPAYELGVGHHDQRVVAAELELDALAVPRRLVADRSSRCDRTGERDRAHARVGDERGADDGAAPRDHVEHARRQVGLGERLRDVQAG